MISVCEWTWLGTVEYCDAWDLQRTLAQHRARREVPDTLLLLEHPPVYTTGRRHSPGNLRVPRGMLGAPLIETDRGGEITFHGPGQLIAYPIVDLKRAGLGIVDYVRGLEEVVLRTLRCYRIEAHLVCGLTGAWVGEEKIAAIGVRVSRPGGSESGWVTSHGLALNVDVDLGWFSRIVPCGIADRGVTSMKALLRESIRPVEVAPCLAAEFGRVFGARMEEKEPGALAGIMRSGIL